MTSWRYNVLSESHVFFQLVSIIKVIIVAKIKQSAYLCVMCSCQAQNFNISRCLTWFLILGSIQHGGDDDDHCWWRHRPPVAPPPICTRVEVWIWMYVRGLIISSLTDAKKVTCARYECITDWGRIYLHLAFLVKGRKTNWYRINE